MRKFAAPPASDPPAPRDDRPALLPWWVHEAVPCAERQERCTGPHHPWAVCCRLRALATAGQRVEVDDGGTDGLHLLLAEGNRPRASIGGVGKVCEPEESLG